MESNVPQAIVQETTTKEYVGNRKGLLKLYRVTLNGIAYHTLAENLEEATFYLSPYGGDAAVVEDSAFVLPLEGMLLSSPEVHELAASLREVRSAVVGFIDTTVANLLSKNAAGAFASSEFKEAITESFHAIEDELVKKANAPRTQEIAKK